MRERGGRVVTCLQWPSSPFLFFIFLSYSLNFSDKRNHSWRGTTLIHLFIGYCLLKNSTIESGKNEKDGSPGSVAVNILTYETTYVFFTTRVQRLNKYTLHILYKNYIFIVDNNLLNSRRNYRGSEAPKTVRRPRGSAERSAEIYHASSLLHII